LDLHDHPPGGFAPGFGAPLARAPGGWLGVWFVAVFAHCAHRKRVVPCPVNDINPDRTKPENPSSKIDPIKEPTEPDLPIHQVN
jgi:hypothetical protein